MGNSFGKIIKKKIRPDLKRNKHTEELKTLDHNLTGLLKKKFFDYVKMTFLQPRKRFFI